MLKRVTHFRYFDKSCHARAICVNVPSDQLMIVTAHDPVELSVQNEYRHFHAGPSCCEIQFLQLLIKC